MEQGNKLSIRDILTYEVHSSWLAPYISFALGQDLMGSYFARKVERKYKRYIKSIEYRNRIINELKG